MLEREEWEKCARDLDWEFTYVASQDVYPVEISGAPWLSFEEWQDWEEPYRTTYRDYVHLQSDKNRAIYAVRNAVGRIENFQARSRPWLSALKLYGATFALAEFAAVIGNLRSGRFARTAAWRNASCLGALDEMRHTEIPLVIMHDLVKWDPQFDWVHRLYHTNNWVALAARHMVDELLLGTDVIEFAIATHFVFETGFTNLQFIGLSPFADGAGDVMFAEMIKSIQTDEARHAQIGPAVLEKIVAKNPDYAQHLVDKWFWRSWHLFAVVTGFSMDYLTPLAARTCSFKEFMHEWVIEQYIASLKRFGLRPPWYWETFLSELDYNHHMVYASAYSYRSTVWFDLTIPSPEERDWLAEKYPKSWPSVAPIWERVAERWEGCDPEVDFAVHGTSIIGFCSLCQFVLCAGTPQHNTARVVSYTDHSSADGAAKPSVKKVFCSEPCQRLYEAEPERYASHLDLVQRVLVGQAPGNLLAMLTQYFDLSFHTWGKDSAQGVYPWMQRMAKPDISHGSLAP